MIGDFTSYRDGTTSRTTATDTSMKKKMKTSGYHNNNNNNNNKMSRRNSNSSSTEGEDPFAGAAGNVINGFGMTITSDTNTVNTGDSSSKETLHDWDYDNDNDIDQIHLPVFDETTLQQYQQQQQQQHSLYSNNNDETNSDQLSSTADAFIAEKLSQLTVQEREKVYYDVHGVSNVVPETPEFVQFKRQDLRHQLQLLVNKYQNQNQNSSSLKNDDDNNDNSHYTNNNGITTGYQMALQMDESYVTNEVLELQFLRSERFDTKLAAIRMLKHFQYKLELFGPTKLTKDIRQDEDLNQGQGNDNALEALYQGFQQILPLRDRAGRLVVADFPSLGKFDGGRSVLTRLRHVFYIAMVAAEDVESQKKGCIFICYVVNCKSPYPYEFGYFRKLLDMTDCLPLRYEAVHFCCNSWYWAPQIAIYKLAANIFNSLRFRVHYGDCSECLFKLQTFGVPVSVMPIKADGQSCNEQNIKTWTQRREYERRLSRQEEKSLLQQQQRQQQQHDDNSKQTKDASSTTTTNSSSTTTTSYDKNTLINKNKSETNKKTNNVEQQQQGDDVQNNDNTENNNNNNNSSNNEKEPPPQQQQRQNDDGDDDRNEIIILFPGQFDVLLGRGKGFHNHVGNIKFRHIVQQYKHQYDESSKVEKKRMTMDIVHQIQAMGGRFLRQHVEGWTPILNDEESRLKVSHTFRNIKGIAANNNNNNNNGMGGAGNDNDKNTIIDTHTKNQKNNNNDKKLSKKKRPNHLG